ncbi:MAG: Bro-N domain-containing protein [Thermoanaerobacter sp.]|nr:Bro-N domain-containing protein [Thermoanaerobacter sp.]
MSENSPVVLTKQFEGKTVHTFIWNGRLCWIAGEIASAIGYDDPASAVKNCIEREEFEAGLEYDVLRGAELDSFREMVNFVMGFEAITNKTRNLTVFYEEGLYGFLAYTDRPEGKRFKKWIRRDEVERSLQKAQRSRQEAPALGSPGAAIPGVRRRPGQLLRRGGGRVVSARSPSGAEIFWVLKDGALVGFLPAGFLPEFAADVPSFIPPEAEFVPNEVHVFGMEEDLSELLPYALVLLKHGFRSYFWLCRGKWWWERYACCTPAGKRLL